VHYPAFFHQLLRDVHQQYKEQAKLEFFCPSHFKKRRCVPALKRALAVIRSGHACEDSAGGLFLEIAQKSIQLPVSGDYLSPKKV